MFIRACVHVCVCMFVHVYMCVHIYIHINIHKYSLVPICMTRNISMYQSLYVGHVYASSLLYISRVLTHASKHMSYKCNYAHEQVCT